jgi:prepilin-type processing-associated H-X9-DG protein
MIDEFVGGLVLLAFCSMLFFLAVGVGPLRSALLAVLVGIALLLSFGSLAGAAEGGWVGAGISVATIRSYNYAIIGPLWGSVAVLALWRRPKRAVVAAAIAWVVSAECVTLLGAGIGMARCSARRATCVNNLKQIGLALHNYHDFYHSFPPAYIPDADGKPMHSWRVLILPFMEYKTMYDSYDFNEPWDGPHNKHLSEMTLGEFCCPKDAERASRKRGETSYVVVVGDETAWPGPRGMPLSEIGGRDVLGKKILVVEVANSGINWTEPRDLSFADMDFHINGKPGRSVSSGHELGVNVMMADGSVRTLPLDLSPDELRAMLTVKGGEPTPPKEP